MTSGRAAFLLSFLFTVMYQSSCPCWSITAVTAKSETCQDALNILLLQDTGVSVPGSALEHHRAASLKSIQGSILNSQFVIAAGH